MSCHRVNKVPARVRAGKMNRRSNMCVLTRSFRKFCELLQCDHKVHSQDCTPHNRFWLGVHVGYLAVRNIPIGKRMTTPPSRHVVPAVDGTLTLALTFVAIQTMKYTNSTGCIQTQPCRMLPSRAALPIDHETNAYAVG